MLTSSISSRAFEIIVKTIYLIAEFEVFEQLNQWQIPVPRYAQKLLKKSFCVMKTGIDYSVQGSFIFGSSSLLTS